MLGFWATYKLLSAGKRYAAFLQIFVRYFGMFFILVHGWDGKGYQRFFSQNHEEFLRWTPDNIVPWLTSPVALTLGAMGAIMIPVMISWMTRWMTEAQRSLPSDVSVSRVVHRYSQPVLAAIMLVLIFGIILGTAIVASLLIHQLGWAPGLVAFALVGGVGVLSPKGLLHALWVRLDPNPATEITSPTKPASQLVATVS